MAGEPAGKILTRTAGAVEVRATMYWQPGQTPEGPVLSSLSNDHHIRCSFVEETDEAAAGCSITGVVRAFDERDLRRTVESVLRDISAASALREAVLEARAVRLAMPAVTPADVLAALTLDLQDSGFPVSFGRSWSFVTGAEVACGTGDGPELAGFLLGHPAWVVLA